MDFSAFSIGVSGMQANNLWLDRTGNALANTSVAVQAIGPFEMQLGNASVTGLDPSGTMTPGLGNFSADTLDAFDMGIGSEIIDLMLAQQGFQVNARTIDTASQTSQTVSMLG